MSTIVTAIRLTDVAYFLRGTRLVKEDEDAILLIDEGPWLGKRDIDARTALRFVQAGLAVPCEYSPRVVTDVGRYLEDYTNGG